RPFSLPALATGERHREVVPAIAAFVGQRRGHQVANRDEAHATFGALPERDERIDVLPRGYVGIDGAQPEHEVLLALHLPVRSLAPRMEQRDAHAVVRFDTREDRRVADQLLVAVGPVLDLALPGVVGPRPV